MSRLVRTLGVLTAAYGAAVIVRPEVMAKPTGMVDRHGRAPSAVALLTRAVGVRDVASGLAMVFAPSRRTLDLAVAVRVASDLGDGVVFGTTLSDKGLRAKAAGVAGGWGVVNALAWAVTRDRD